MSAPRIVSEEDELMQLSLSEAAQSIGMGFQALMAGDICFARALLRSGQYMVHVAFGYYLGLPLDDD